MTREEYLKALKNEIMALTSDEQAEALQFYSDYFEEANDDERVISELGSPEELAKTITEKFANAVVKTENNNNSDNSNSGSCDDESVTESVYYSFSRDSVKNIDFSFGVAEIVLINGDKYSIETRGLGKNDIECNLKSDGTLDIHNVKKLCLNFFSHNRTTRIVPRILITVPNGVVLNRFNLSVGAGDFRGKDVAFSCKKGKIEVGAGNLILSRVSGGEISFRCGMGNLEFAGTVLGKSNIDCGMGNLKLLLDGNYDDYSYDLKLGLGDFKFNTEKQSGFYQNVNNTRKSNHFSVNCGMGSVNIKIK